MHLSFDDVGGDESIYIFIYIIYIYIFFYMYFSLKIASEHYCESSTGGAVFAQHLHEREITP